MRASPPPESSTEQSVQPAWLIPCLLAVWTVVAFHGVFSHGFVAWDDDHYVYENQAVQTFDVAWMFTQFHMGHYHPLTWLSLACDHAVWGLDARGFLATNLLLHVISGLLLFALWRRMRTWLTEPSPASDWLGALAVAVFLVHPLRAEAVAWVSDRKELLASVFCLASLWLYCRGMDEARPARWVLASGVLFALSLLSKATAVGLPLALLALDVWLFRRLTVDGVPLANRRAATLPQLLGEKWLHFAAMGVMLVIAPLAQTQMGAAVTLTNHPLPARLAQAAYNLCFHPWKTLWPSGLCCQYPLSEQLDPLSPMYLACGLLVGAALAGAAWSAWRRNPWPAVLLGTYALLVLPVSGLWQSGGQFAADRYSYFPAMLLALATAGVPVGWFTANFRRLRVAQVATAALLCALLAATTQQVATWRDSLTLWRNAVECVPDNALAWSFLARIYQEQGDQHEAQACYDRAVASCPTSAILVNAGGFAAATGQAQKARDLYEQALAKSPHDPAAHYNLANLLMRGGATDEALMHYAEAHRLDARSFATAANYGRALLVAKRAADAAEVYRAAVELAPDQAVGWEGLGAALLAQGDLEGACTALARSQASPSATPHGAWLWAQALDKQGDRPAALRVLSEARRRWPEETAHRERSERR